LVPMHGNLAESTPRHSPLFPANSLFEHDLFGKPVSTFPDHALSFPHVRARPRRSPSSPPRSRPFRAVGDGAARPRAGIDPDREGLCRSDLAGPADRAL